MRRVVGGILKCTRALLGQARWFIARAIDVVVPYQFLSNQLRDCTVKGGQFQCPTCTIAIIERIAAGKVTVKGVVHRIAKYEAAHDWKITYPEMKAAVIQELASLGVKTNRNVRQIPISMLQVSLKEFLSGQHYPWGEGKFSPYCDKVNAPIWDKNPNGYVNEGTYHKLLRKGANMLRKGRKWIGLTVLVVGLSHVIVHHALPAYQAYQYDVDLQDTAMLVDTRPITTWVDSLHLSSDGNYYGGHVDEDCCNRCNKVVGKSWNPAHGHTLTIQPSWYEEPQKYSKYVRTCSSR